MGSLENGLAAVAACLPVLRPVFNKCIYGSIDAPNAEPPGATAAGGVGVWRRTIGGRKILVTGDGLSAGWKETTGVTEKGHSRGGSRVSDSV